MQDKGDDDRFWGSGDIMVDGLLAAGPEAKRGAVATTGTTGPLNT